MPGRPCILGLFLLSTFQLTEATTAGSAIDANPLESTSSYQPERLGEASLGQQHLDLVEVITSNPVVDTFFDAHLLTNALQTSDQKLVVA